MERKQELHDEINTISKSVLNLFETKKKEDGTYDFNADELKQVQEAEPKLEALRKELHALTENDRIKQMAENLKAAANAPNRGGVPLPTNAPGDGGAAQPFTGHMKSIGQAFIESDAFKKYDPATHAGPQVEVDLKSIVIPGVNEYKTTVDTGTSYAPQAIRIPYISEFPTRPLTVNGIVPQGTTTQIAIVYMEETTYTNAAAETAEGAAKPEGALAFTQRTSNVRKIAVWVPVTDELMEDAPQIETYVNNRLGFMVRQRLDSQMIVGDGIGNNLLGILNVSGVQTQAVGADSEADAAHKALTKVMTVGFADPTNFVLHPNNWQKIRLMKTTTGQYIYGAPWEVGPGTLWGLPVVATTAITSGTGLCGAFTPHCQFFTKKDLALSVGYINDQFIKNLLSLLAEMRGAFVVFRPTAFCAITGMGT